jgi:zinc finger protein ZPR1
MHIVDIPFFKETIIMATTCDACGYKSNEVKSGGPISQKGKIIKLTLNHIDDLSRDILKSESCKLHIPEIDLCLNTGTLGGRFTTVEGLLRQIHDELKDKCPFNSGDAADKTHKDVLNRLLDEIDMICSSKKPCTLILNDPLSNSYIQNINAPEDDPKLEIIVYERSLEQNEEFGLNDLDVQ